MVERLTTNQEVACSSPVSVNIFFQRSNETRFFNCNFVDLFFVGVGWAVLVFLVFCGSWILE